MHARDLARQTIELGGMFTKMYLADLSDADLVLRPVPGMNHIAWQLGHLISVERQAVEEVSPGSCPPLPEGFEAKHSKEAAASDDAAHFYTKAEYLAAWEAQHAATLAVLAKLNDEQLDAPAPEKWRKWVPTNAHALNFLGTHTLMHVGQYVATRRKLGKAITM